MLLFYHLLYYLGMKPPELSVLWSPSIDTELLVGAHELVPSPDDLSALTDRLGLETPDTLTAALLRPEERQLNFAPHFSDNLDLDNPADPTTPRSPDSLRVFVGELSEQDILVGFAHALMVRARLNRRINVLKWGGIAAMTELGLGGIVWHMGSSWGYVGMGLAGGTAAGLWLHIRSWHNSSEIVVPDLGGLESPIRITGHTH